MATGVVPFEGASFQLLVKHAFEDPIAPGQRRPDVYVPRSLDELIMETLRKAPDTRPTADQLLERLAKLSLTLGERERSRGRELLEGRAARMIPTVRPRPDEAPKVGQGTHATELAYRATAVPEAPSAAGAKTLGVVGEISSEMTLGLRANGFTPVEVKGPPIPEGVVALFAPGAHDDLLRTLMTFGLPVLTDAPADDVDRMSRMVGLGIADVVPLPLRIEMLATKVQRALKKHARRAR
jgi:hypothetical protein